MAEKQTETLKAERRSDTGSRACRTLRETGRIPGIVYGKGEDNIPVSVDLITLMHMIEHGARVINLDVDGDVKSVIIKELQHGTYDHQILHADFRVITADTLVTVEVEIELDGEAPGIEEGGVMTQEFYMLTVECKPNDIPDTIVIDVSQLNLGDVIYVRDVPVPPGCTFEHEEDAPVVVCTHPTAEEPEEGEEEGEEAAGEGVEPEVIGEKKEEEEEED